MKDGVIEQQGEPLELFERPASTFVAGFLGSPRMSFLPGTLMLDGPGRAVRIGDLAVPLGQARRPDGAVDGQSVLLGLRAEHISRARGDLPDGCFRVDAVIELVQPTGPRSYATFRLAGAPVMAELQAHDVGQPGERIAIDVNMRRASVFDADTGRAL